MGARFWQNRIEFSSSYLKNTIVAQMLSLALISLLLLLASPIVQSQTDDSPPDAADPKTDDPASKTDDPAESKTEDPDASKADDPAALKAEDPEAGSKPKDKDSKNGTIPGFALVKPQYFETGLTSKPAEAKSAKECATSCSEEKDCQAFAFLNTTNTCTLHQMRPCMIPAKQPGSAKKVDYPAIYEKKANVTVGTKAEMTQIANDPCGTYTGAMVNQTRIKNQSVDPEALAELAKKCGQSCVDFGSKKKATSCASYMFIVQKQVAKNGTESAVTTCTLYRDSIFTTFPTHGTYSATGLTGKCDEKIRSSWYGIQGEVPSVLSCGKKLAAV